MFKAAFKNSLMVVNEADSKGQLMMKNKKMNKDDPENTENELVLGR
jgi:hypothetical protein